MNYSLITYSYLHPEENTICINTEVFNKDIITSINILEKFLKEGQTRIKVYSIMEAKLIPLEIYNTYYYKGMGVTSY